MNTKKHTPGSSTIVVTRVGLGYDIHPFAPKRKLILGGVLIPSAVGLQGHSDADVLLHAICDALLGSLALGDIGKHFPDNDKRYKGIASSELLTHVVRLLKKNNATIINIDSTLILEKPKIAPYVQAMQQCIAKAAGLTSSQISIKATTNEKLGSLGRREGCAAFAVAAVQCPIGKD